MTMKHKTYLRINVIAFIGFFIILLFTADFSKTKSTEETLCLLFTLSAIAELVVDVIMLAMLSLQSIVLATSIVCRHIFWWVCKRKRRKSHRYEFLGFYAYALIPSDEPKEIVQFMKRMIFVTCSCISAIIAISLLLYSNDLLGCILSIIIVCTKYFVFRIVTVNT